VQRSHAPKGRNRMQLWTRGSQVFSRQAPETITSVGSIRGRATAAPAPPSRCHRIQPIEKPWIEGFTGTTTSRSPSQVETDEKVAGR
jgi:hypothetical protein